MALYFKAFSLVLMAAFLFGQWVQAANVSSEVKLNTKNEYLALLRVHEDVGGILRCVDGEKEYFSCEEFDLLHTAGCYGHTTHSMKVETYFAENCKRITRLVAAQETPIHYFGFDAEDWWQKLPAEIIPLQGGIYSGLGWAEAQRERTALVNGKFLGEIGYESVVSSGNEVEIILSTEKPEWCEGTISDQFHFTAVLLADYDEDNIAELLITGWRIKVSDNCLLGSGNSLGASFTTIVKKSGEMKDAVIIK